MGMGDADSPIYTQPGTRNADTISSAAANGVAPTPNLLLGFTLNAQNAGYSATAIQTAAPAAGSVAYVDARARATVEVQVNSNTLTSALGLQASLDGNTWVPVGGTPFVNQTTGQAQTSIPAGAVGAWDISVAAFQYVRVTTTAAPGGVAVIICVATSVVAIVGLDNALPGPLTSTGGAIVALAAATDTPLTGVSNARSGLILSAPASNTAPVLYNFGATASSATVFTGQLAPGATIFIERTMWTGAVRGFCTAVGSVNVTTTTP